jgi:energy-converting hydrogenase Eha subunit H
MVYSPANQIFVIISIGYVCFFLSNFNCHQEFTQLEVIVIVYRLSSNKYLVHSI